MSVLRATSTAVRVISFDRGVFAPHATQLRRDKDKKNCKIRNIEKRREEGGRKSKEIVLQHIHSNTMLRATLQTCAPHTQTVREREEEIEIEKERDSKSKSESKKDISTYLD